MTAPGSDDLTRLVIPVAELSDTVPGAHIALLDPFLPASQVDDGLIGELREIFSELVSFPFVLGEPARFPSGAAYLPPQPVGVFRRISQNLRRTFPELVGHPTSLHGSIPHLALGDEAADAVPTPLEVHAREAVLLGPGGAVLARFQFGTSAA
ncbi:MAG: 2'-5' RNA ligase family protein [Marmoricola sp.]